MTESPGPADEELFAALAALRKATSTVSYTMLVRQATAQVPPVKISAQRLSDWFSGKAVPDDPAAVRFLVEYLQPKAARTSGYQQRRLEWWQALHLNAVQQRQANRDDGGKGAAVPRTRRRLGRRISDCDPVGPGGLEVHPAIRMPGSSPADALPRYVPRAHDARLQETVDRMLQDGRSQLITLVGGSSTGKTRACWELARYMEQQQPRRWRLWHPCEPTRPEAALADLARVGPDTIVWLNEAQFYLQPTRLGERITAGLRTLLRDLQRGPVLVLATLWPQFWNELTFRPEFGEPDPYEQARDLLTGSRVRVPDEFTPGELAALDDTEVDPRVRQAVDQAEGGRISQYLAGAPGLQDRYDTAPPAAKAIIRAAIDARRLGHPPALPHVLLEQAAPGYLDDHDWDSLDDDWLEQALAYAARPCKGARGPLTRIRSRIGGGPSADEQPCYRLADYLEQTGRHERAGVYPPDSLWTTFVTTITDFDLLRNLGRQAENRGRYQHAIRLYRRAADRGDIGALPELARQQVRAGDSAGAQSLYRQAADSGNTDALRHLADMQARAGDTAGAEALYRQAADRGDTGARHELLRLRVWAGDTAGAEALALEAADRGDTSALRDLVGLRERVGDTASAEALYLQAADRGDTGGLRVLAGIREQAGDTASAEALYRQAADRGDTYALRMLAKVRERAGDTTGAEALYRQAADRGDTDALPELAEMREGAGDTAGAENLALQIGDRGDTSALQKLARMRERAGDTAGAEALYRQAADRGDTFSWMSAAVMRERSRDTLGAEALALQAADRGDTDVLSVLAGMRERAGDTAGAETLYRRAADRGDTGALCDLAEMRERAGDTAGAEALYRQAADRGDTTALLGLVILREQARDIVGAETLALQSADRGDTYALRSLAEMREGAGDTAGAETLYRRAADRGDPNAMLGLVMLLEEIGDTAIADRIRRFGLASGGEAMTRLDFDL